MKAVSLAVLGISVMLLAACGVEHARTDAEAFGNTVTADAAWQALTSSDSRPVRKQGEDSLAYFMREVELSDSRFRQLGMEFWKKYPDDPRRYKWLLRTVHMPPHYAKDVGGWAQNETRLAPNAAALDRAALDRWNSAYPAMRQAFWSAKEVTDQERRFLWFGELEQTLLRMRERVARGERVEPGPLLAEIVKFVESYPEPSSTSDSKELGWNIKALVFGVIGNSRAFNIGVREKLSFVDLIRKQSAFANAMWNQQVEFIEYAVVGHYRERAGIELQLLEQWEWSKDVVAALGAVSEGERQWDLLPKYPLDQPTTEDGWYIFWHNEVVWSRKYRDIGLRLWEEYPLRAERWRWLNKTLFSPPYYPAPFADGIRAIAAGDNVAFETDKKAEAEWDARYAKLRATFWNDPLTTSNERAELTFHELMPLLLKLQRKGADKSGVPALLAGAQELYKEYGNAKPEGSPMGSLRMAHWIFEGAPALGLSIDDLEEFIAPMLSSKDDEIRSFAESKRDYFALRQLPLQLTAPTLKGSNFDIVSLRGKIVLVDYWATTCASCISSMPRIHDVYKSYKGRGFEVVSVCADGKSQQKKVLRIEEELGLTWTTLAGDDVWDEIADCYYGGYGGVPQYMLLDREGKLIAGTGEIDMGRNLESLIIKILAAE